MPRYPLLPNCIFRETFESQLSVAQNGGVVTDAPSINNGIIVKGNNVTLVTYPKSAPTMNKTKMTVHIKFRSGGDITTVNDFLDKWDDSANNQFVTTLVSGTFTMYVASSMTDMGSNKGASAAIAAADTEYDLVWVYDGTLAAANRLKLYVNGVSTALTITGTIPATLTRSNVPITACGMSGAPLSKAGHTIKLLEVFDGALSQGDVDDLYQQDTITEIDALKALVHLPLKSWYYKENGTQMLTSPNVAASWTVGSSTITEDDGGVKITGPQYSYGSQAISLVSGKRYKLTGWVKGDGNGYTVLKDNGAGGAWFQGTSSTSWQQIGGSAAGVEFVATGAVFVAYQYGAGTYSCWIKDLRIELMEARTDNIGSLGGYALLGDGSTTTTFPTFSAPHKVSNTTLTCLRGLGNFTNTNSYTIIALLSAKYSGAGTNRYIFDLRSSGTGVPYAYIDTSNNIQSHGSNTIYLNGNVVSSGVPFTTGDVKSLVVVTTLTADHTQYVVGGRYDYSLTVPSDIYAFAIYPGILTATQAKALHDKMMKLLNV